MGVSLGTIGESLGAAIESLGAAGERLILWRIVSLAKCYCSELSP